LTNALFAFSLELFLSGGGCHPSYHRERRHELSSVERESNCYDRPNGKISTSIGCTIHTNKHFVI
jgi:hypothetical protein